MRAEKRRSMREANAFKKNKISSSFSIYKQQPVIIMPPEEYEKEVSGSTAFWKHHVKKLLSTITMMFSGKNRRARRFGKK